MDLSAVDLISKYYSPHEVEIRKIFSASPRFKDCIVSFIDAFPKDWFLSDPRNKIITDQLLDKDLYKEKTIYQLPDSIFGIYFIPGRLEDQPIEFDYNLFLNRASVDRLFLFYKIVEMNWLDSGSVSYIGSTARTSNPNLSPKEFVDHLHTTYFHPHYNDVYEFVRDRVPYQNFDDSGDLRQNMLRTKLSFVVETYHERIDAIPFSEKIFRAIQVPRPWVLSGATGSVARLRSLGFDVFDDYIDHSYDKHDTSRGLELRHSGIFAEMKRMKNFKVTASILDDWNKKYQKNLDLLSNWHDNWRDDLEIFINKYF